MEEEISALKQARKTICTWLESWSHRTQVRPPAKKQVQQPAVQTTTKTIDCGQSFVDNRLIYFMINAVY